jgi:hypothetical protein
MTIKGDHYGYKYEEYEYICPNKCYYEHFSYGVTEIHMGGAILGYYYLDDNKIIKKVKKQVNLLAKLEKEYKGKN